MTCWKPRTTGLSPAGNWFFSQFIVSICTLIVDFPILEAEDERGEKKTDANMSIFPAETGGRCTLANVHMRVRIH